MRKVFRNQSEMFHESTIFVQKAKYIFGVAGKHKRHIIHMFTVQSSFEKISNTLIIREHREVTQQIVQEGGVSNRHIHNWDGKSQGFGSGNTKDTRTIYKWVCTDTEQIGGNCGGMVVVFWWYLVVQCNKTLPTHGGW